MHSVDLYRSLEKTDTPPGWRECGSIKIASTPERMQEIRRQIGWAKTFGLDLKEISLGEIKDLEFKGYVKILDDQCSEVIVKTKAINLFELKEDNSIDAMFKSFWENYPIRVGTRILRSKDINSKESTEVKRKLGNYLKVPGNYDKLMKGLRNELILRKKDNSLVYMQMIITYVNQRTWEKYYDMEEEEPIQKVEGI
jgi:hypothetical protein